MNTPTLIDIQKATERIRPYAHRTPVLTSSSINHKVNAQVFFECENFQKVGAFKFRGACNTVLSLSEKEAARGVATDPTTIADGLLTSLGDLTFAIIQDRVEQIVTVSEGAIVEAMRHIWERNEDHHYPCQVK